MIKYLKDFSVHIGVMTLVGMMIWSISTGRAAGNFESEVRANTEFRHKSLPKIEQVPVLESEMKSVKEDVKYTRRAVDEIKNLLLNR